MSIIRVYSFDSIASPEKVSKAFNKIEEEAKKIPCSLETPLFLAYRLEEVSKYGTKLSEITTFAKYTSQYIDPLLDIFLNNNEDTINIFDYKEIMGSDPAVKISKSKRDINHGFWKLTHAALVNPFIPVNERRLSKDFPFKETIKSVPEYSRQVHNSGFFNGKFNEEKIEEFLKKDHIKEDGINLLLDLIEDPELQQSFFDDLQIPLISTYHTQKIWDIVNERNKQITLYNSQVKAYQKKMDKYYERLENHENLELLPENEQEPPTAPEAIPTDEEWFAAQNPIIRNQVVELFSLWSRTKFNTSTKKNDVISNKNSIMEIPCVLYALQKCGVSEEIIEEFKKSRKIFGPTIKTRVITEILSKHRIQLVVHSNKKTPNPVPGRITDLQKFPRDSKTNGLWTKIEVDRFENHMFQRKFYYSKRAGKNVSALVAIINGFQSGLLTTYNAYEFYKYFENCTLDPMIKFDLRKYFREHTSENFIPHVRNLKLKKRSSNPDVVYFADFETTTNEEFHIPYMVHCIGPKIDQTFYGEDCAYKMLAEINEKVGKVNKINKKTGELEEAVPLVRIYFHNLKYDYTFIRGLLKKIDECTKGNQLYSASGYFTTRNTRKYIKLDFWDTLPIMRCKLSKAAEYYIGGERAQQFKKEACPYGFYTRENFKKYPNNWAPIEEFKQKFNTEKDLELFNKTLPDLPETIYNKTLQEINFMEYSAFYCRQDVIIMKEAFENIRKLFLGKEIEGIHGTPPFSIDVYQYRTISSLAWAHFLQATFGDILESNEKPKPELPIYEISETERILGRAAVRGGRTMMGYNKESHYVSPDPNNPDYDVVDFDAVSLYPSAGSRAWISEGKPSFIKPPEGTKWTRKEFLEWFETPESKEKTKKYSDGWLFVTQLHVNIPRAFPMICVKDPKTHLNNYENFNHQQVETMISMTDLYNLIDFQDGEFEWEGALVWTGPRNFKCQDVFKDLNEFRKKNHNLVDEEGNDIPDHPIATLSKLVSNSIYGKSNQKIQNFETNIIDKIGWGFNKLTRSFMARDVWQEYFNANAYKIIDFEPLAGNKNHIKVRQYRTDKSFALIQFAITILAISKRIIGPVLCIAEDVAKEMNLPGPFYTDTDSMHILRKTLPETARRFEQIYGYPLIGKDLGQFHIDFDTPANFKKDPKTGKFIEKVRGAIECYFCAKKVYIDKLIGTMGTIGYHPRMKGICSELVKWEDYEKFYNNLPVTYDLVQAKPSFVYEEGHVKSLSSMIRTVMSRACREALKHPRPVEENPVIEILDETEESDVVVEDVPAKRQKI